MKKNNVPSKKEVQKIAELELEKYLGESFEFFSGWIKKNYIKTYEIQTEYGEYQVQIDADWAVKEKTIVVCASIDGPGVFHFFNFVNTVSAFFTKNKDQTILRK